MKLINDIIKHNKIAGAALMYGIMKDQKSLIKNYHLTLILQI